MTLEEIGALLGFVAFGGLAVLVFLTFQQARHLRRLREWAGRGPERAAALESRRGGAERSGESEREEDGMAEPREPWFAGLRATLAERWAALDRRLPVDGRVFFGGLAAILLGLVIATSGFGLFGSDEGPADREPGGQSVRNEGGGGGNRGDGGNQAAPAEVAVLNATAPPGGTGTPGIADRLAGDVEGAGFEVAEVGNAGSLTETVVMWRGDAEDDAEELADALAPVLGEMSVTQMTGEIEGLSGSADVALVVGQDDAGI